METYMVRIYAGPLSQDCDYVSVEAEKSTPSIEIVQVAIVWGIHLQLTPIMSSIECTGGEIRLGCGCEGNTATVLDCHSILIILLIGKPNAVHDRYSKTRL
jgi:hypothetical protein